MSQSYEFHMPFGGVAQVEPFLSMYRNDDNIYMGLTCYDPEFGKRPYTDVTVNLCPLPEYCAAIDTNNNTDAIVDFLVENGFGELTGKSLMSGYCEYPVFKFDAEVLRGIDPHTMEAHERAKGVTPSQKPTFYFTFGSANYFPYQEGWVEVKADSLEQAQQLFRSHFPDRIEGTINCAFFYDEQEWRQTPMSQGAPGQFRHQVIDSPGEHQSGPAKDKSFSSVIEKAKDRIGEKPKAPSDAPRKTKHPQHER